jgi:ParB family chromosome partitioning protein
MSKLDELRRVGASAAAESMGAGVPIHGVSTVGPIATARRWQGIAKAKNVADIPTEKITPDPDQPREEFDRDALDRLAESLKTRGQLQAIRVRWDEGRGAYVILCGERRWRAATMAGLATVRAEIHEGALAPADLLALQLVENALREDLRPIEQARAYRTLLDRNGWSTRELARELSIAQPQVVRTLALLDLPASVQEHVEQGALPPATAYEVSKVEDPAEQAALAARVVAEGLTRAETVRAVKHAGASQANRKQGRGAGKARARKVVERVLKTAPGPRVTIAFRKGLDAGLIRAALADALRTIESEGAAVAPNGGDTPCIEGQDAA